MFIVMALFLETVIAAAASFGASFLFWWLPLIVFPVLVGFGNYQYQAPMWHSPYRTVIDFILMLHQIGWIIVAAFITYYGFGAWWGALLGCLFGFLGAGWMAPRRWATEIRNESN